MSWMKSMAAWSVFGLCAFVARAAEAPATQPTRGAVSAGGIWLLKEGSTEQISQDTPSLLLFGDSDWKDYVFELEAQATGGEEGFLIAVRAKDAENLVWLNVGGWGDTRTAFEFANGASGKSDLGNRQTYGEFAPVITDQWHKLKVVVSGNRMEGFVDGKSACKFEARTITEGGVGLGTWATQANFRNLKVSTLEGKTLWEGIPNQMFNAAGGSWRFTPDAVEQTSAETPALLFFGREGWTDYTVELEAKKTGGSEGFLIATRALEIEKLVWLNVGGWGNTRTAFEFADGENGKTDLGEDQTYGEFKEVQTDQWHKLKVVVSGKKMEGFLDGVSACKFEAATIDHGCVGLGTWSTQAQFRKIKVTGSDGKTLWEGFWPTGK